MTRGDDGPRFRDMTEARELAEAYAADAKVTVRALADQRGRSYGYVHRRVSALTPMRSKGRRVQADDGNGE